MSKLKFKKGDRLLTNRGIEVKVVNIDANPSNRLPYLVRSIKSNNLFWKEEHELKHLEELEELEDTITIKAPKALEDKIRTMISEHNKEEHRKNVNRKALEKLEQIFADNIGPDDQVLNEIATKSISLIRIEMQEYGEI